ncbi:Protein hob1 [Ceratocystis lukuohia]|uniref:Protein hob1 n=1 Tax=Ceratocystis lukuohia TaxID=2019550 RepID=A0ABR4MF18_9PEZI
MQATRRQLGKLINRDQVESSHASVVIREYEDIDRLLARLVDDSRSLRDSWVHLGISSLNTSTELLAMYRPYIDDSPSPEPTNRPPERIPELQMSQASALEVVYHELKADIVNEVTMFDAGVINPASKARELIAGFRKTIKKREAKRVDFEKSQEKVTKIQKKTSALTPKEEVLLTRAQQDLDHAKEELSIMDEYLETTLSKVVGATMQLVIPLVSSLASTQIRLLGMTYTALHNYCQENDFPSPAPDMDEILADWTTAFKPVQRQFEAISFISTGRGRLAALDLGDDTPPRPTLGARASTTALARKDSTPPPPSGLREGPHTLAPTDFTAAARLGSAAIRTPVTRAVSVEHFGHQSTSQTHSTQAHRPGMPQPSSAPVSSVLATKKKPPPPPPKKPTLKKAEEYVIAQFDFAGQGAGDLPFRQGDRIKIIKKTNTDQDWWEGEIGNARGSFPANYCKPA